MNFHQLINNLSKEQRVYQFPYIVEKPADSYQLLEFLFRQLKYEDKNNEFEIVPSCKREDSILNAFINILYQYPSTQIENYIGNLKNYICHWMIIYKHLMAEYRLNATKINYYLSSGLDHEDELLLLAVIFNLNVLVVNTELQFRLYSPFNVGNMYVLLFQHSDLKYSAIKFKPNDKSALSNFTGFMSIIEPNHPLITILISNLLENSTEETLNC